MTTLNKTMNTAAPANQGCSLNRESIIRGINYTIKVMLNYAKADHEHAVWCKRRLQSPEALGFTDVAEVIYRRGFEDAQRARKRAFDMIRVLQRSTHLR